MSTNSNLLSGNKLKNRVMLSDTNLLLIINIVVFLVMYVCAIVFLKSGFTKPQTFLNILNENASLLILSCGMTLVMLTGGIDISVGQVTCLVCMACAVFLNREGGTPYDLEISMLIAIGIGLAFGIIQGYLVAYLEFQPFIVTLIGMTLAKGLTTMISHDRVAVTQPRFEALCKLEINIPCGFTRTETGEIVPLYLGSANKLGEWVNAHVEIGVIIALAVLILLFIMLRWTKLGRSFYAVGGNNQSANMLGINVKLTKFLSHVLCGLCAGIGGYVFFLHSRSGSTLHAQGAEMNAIASAIIGGTMLSGGVGNIVGALFGVLSLSTIKSIVASLGLQDAWWTNITVAGMLCIFLILQSVILSRRNQSKK